MISCLKNLSYIGTAMHSFQWKNLHVIAKIGGYESFVCVRDALDFPGICALFEKRVFALCVPNFLDKDVCAYASKSY